MNLKKNKDREPKNKVGTTTVEGTANFMANTNGGSNVFENVIGTKDSVINFDVEEVAETQVDGEETVVVNLILNENGKYTMEDGQITEATPQPVVDDDQIVVVDANGNAAVVPTSEVIKAVEEM